MRIECSDIEGFLDNLKEPGTKDIFERTVWISITRNPTTEAVDQVMFQASAVIRAENESEYLLQLGIDCGKDYCDNPDKQGSRKAEKLRDELRTFCEGHGLVVLPGIISE